MFENRLATIISYRDSLRDNVIIHLDNYIINLRYVGSVRVNSGEVFLVKCIIL